MHRADRSAPVAGSRASAREGRRRAVIVPNAGALSPFGGALVRRRDVSVARIHDACRSRSSQVAVIRMVTWRFTVAFRRKAQRRIGPARHHRDARTSSRRDLVDSANAVRQFKCAGRSVAHFRIRRFPAPGILSKIPIRPEGRGRIERCRSAHHCAVSTENRLYGLFPRVAFG